jgi:hypothetical protein
MYNAMFGQNPISDVILTMLGLTKVDCGRFRDCSINNGEICIYTRNGGGNREEYDWVFDTLSDHPDYLRDEDDEFDSTYATIYFKFPEKYKDLLTQIDSGEPFKPDEKWQALIATIKLVK